MAKTAGLSTLCGQFLLMQKGGIFNGDKA